MTHQSAPDRLDRIGTDIARMLNAPPIHFPRFDEDGREIEEAASERSDPRIFGSIR